jgi:protein-S-isoprenylcysteine O-methyltransferase Ste14
MSLDKILKSRLWPAAWQVFSRLFIMLGLALLGWGVDDLAGFLSNLVRAVFTVIVITQALLNGWMFLRIPPAPDREHQHDLEHWHYSLAELIFILSAFGDRRNVLTWSENLPLRWAGLGIYLLGSIYAIWANLTWVNHLRHKAEYACDNPVLLYEGPFRWTRYPSLLVLFFYGLGFALTFRSWVGLAFIIPLIYIIFRRISIWEKMNAVRYKKVWALRCHVSKRIIPFLY